MVKEKYYQAVLMLQKKKSLANISVRDIASELGITTGSLYYHFSGKNDLLNEMFCFYKRKLREFILKHQDDNLEEFMLEYLYFGMERKEQFNFTAQSELAHFLSDESIAYSRDIHLELVKKMEINPEKIHQKVIVLGSIRSFLSAPDYFEKCDEKIFIAELMKIIKQE